jgi:lipoate-protein ligase A
VRQCDLSLGSPAENLACDEALLELSEKGGAGEVLRFWEPVRYFVVLGYANKMATEINLEFCSRNHIPILRRCTGGGTVLQGPGCLNYTLILGIDESSCRQSIPATNKEVLGKHQVALAPLVSGLIEKCGQTDLAIGSLKFSGNAQRRRRKFLIFHGSFLLNFDLGLIEKALAMPSHQPAYRANRSHMDFLMNLGLSAELVKRALIEAWDASLPLTDIPFARIRSLTSEQYGQQSWSSKF